MCNNNLAGPQRKFETSIFLWKSRHGGRLAGSSGTKLIGEHKLLAWFQHLPGNWCFISIKNKRSLRKIQKPAAAHNKAKICPFSSTFLKSISWDSPFNMNIVSYYPLNFTYGLWTRTWRWSQLVVNRIWADFQYSGIFLQCTLLTVHFTKLVKFFFIMLDQTLMSVTDAKNVNGFNKIVNFPKYKYNY
jgi:hypothetical protein